MYCTPDKPSSDLWRSLGIRLDSCFCSFYCTTKAEDLACINLTIDAIDALRIMAQARLLQHLAPLVNWATTHTHVHKLVGCFSSTLTFVWCERKIEEVEHRLKWLNLSTLQTWTPFVSFSDIFGESLQNLRMPRMPYGRSRWEVLAPSSLEMLRWHSGLLPQLPHNWHSLVTFQIFQYTFQILSIHSPAITNYIIPSPQYEPLPPQIINTSGSFYY